jgi:hypothetical protein
MCSAIPGFKRHAREAKGYISERCNLVVTSARLVPNLHRLRFKACNAQLVEVVSACGGVSACR